MEVGEARQVDPIALVFQPAEEGPLVARPAGRGVLLGVAVGVSPLHVGIARRRARRQRRARGNARRTGGQAYEAAAQGPVEAQDRRIEIAHGAGDALVGVRAAPVVVGGPGAGRRHQQERRPLAGRCADQEEVMLGEARPVLTASHRLHHITAGAPVGRDRELEFDRPAATHDRAVGRRRIEPAREALGPVHHLGPGAVAHDGQVVAHGGGADVEPQGLAGGIGQPVAVAPDLQLVRIVAGRLVEVLEDRARPHRACRGSPPRVPPLPALVGHGRLPGVSRHRPMPY